MLFIYLFFFFFKQKTAYEMRISDWSSDVCSSDLHNPDRPWRIETGNQIGERRAAGRPPLDPARDGVRIPIEDDADLAAPHATTDDVSTPATEPHQPKPPCLPPRTARSPPPTRPTRRTAPVHLKQTRAAGRLP